jgi:hypothetical protein
MGGHMSIGQDPDKMSERELRHEVKALRHDINTGVCRFDCRGRLKGHVKLLRQVLEMAETKLELYRDHSDGQYHGGIEHTALIGNIKRTMEITK